MERAFQVFANKSLSRQNVRWYKQGGKVPELNLGMYCSGLNLKIKIGETSVL